MWGIQGLGLRSNWGFWVIVAILLLLLAGCQALSALQESQTIDEAAHLAAGYSYWKTRDFRLLPSHPPLAELFCALPLLVLNPNFSPSPEAWREADEYAVGKQFLYQNRISADRLLFAGRMMTILLTLALGLSIAWWTRRRFGTAAAIFALLAYSFSPNIIAHGSYITTDLAVTAFFFWSCMSWVAYLETPSRRKLLQTGVLAGLAFATKFNALILYPIFFVLFLVHRWRTSNTAAPRPSPGMLFTAFLLVPFLIVYSLFFFDTRSVLEDPRLGPRLASASGPVHALAEIPIPAYYYARGLHILVRDLQGGHHNYLLGRNLPHGSWMYFPIAFAVKTRLAVLLLLVICAILAARKLRERWSSFPFVWLGLVLPPLLYFLVCTSSSMNIGLRHLLPVYPFLYVLIGAVPFGINHGSRTGLARASAVVCGMLMIAESFSIHPHYLAFFNIAAGGPQNGPHYLLDSNLDWGQDLKKLKQWTERNDASPLCLSYFGQADPEYYGISYRPLISVRNQQEIANLNCVVAVSSHYLFGTEFQRFGALHNLQPQARIGYSIYVYDLRKTKIQMKPAAFQ